MYRSVVFATCLIFNSIYAVATPYRLIPEESQIEFIVKEMGIPVSGKFKQFETAIDINATKPEKSHAEIKVNVESLTTGNEEADTIALAPEWLDKTHYPYATFKSVSIHALDNGNYETHGSLEIRNQTRPIVFKFNSTFQNDGKTILTGEFIIKRSEYGIGGGIWNEEGVVSEDIPVKVRMTLR